MRPTRGFSQLGRFINLSLLYLISGRSGGHPIQEAEGQDAQASCAPDAGLKKDIEGIITKSFIK
jgi:hypothetical protein